MHELLRKARELSDEQLLASARGLVGRERLLTATLVAHLVEVESRGLALRAGFGSLFAYCQGALGLSEWEAYARIETARAARRFPMILDLLSSNDVSMSVVAVLSPHLTDENHAEVLTAARGVTKAQAQIMAAALAPQADRKTILRRVASESVASDGTTATPVPPAPVVATVTPVTSTAAPAAVAPLAAAAPSPVAPSPAPILQPLAPDRFRYQLTIDADTRGLLTRARELASHADAGGDADLLKKALTLLVSELERRKVGRTNRPRPARGTHPDSRHIPADVRRAVWERDGGSCAYVGPGGRRCGQRRRVEFHHVKPYAAGGGATVGNIQLRCHGHNQHEARVYFRRDQPVAEADVG